MDAPEYDDFGEFFRAHIMSELIKRLDPALDYLRREDPKEWLRIAMELRRHAPYDRIEHLQEQADTIKSLIELVTAGLMSSVPEFVRLHTNALELHFVRHGQELDDLLRRSPSSKPMSARESVDAQINAMDFKVNPSDNR